LRAGYAKKLWQFGSSREDNAEAFATITKWWAGLQGKEVTWQPRPVPMQGSVDDLDWERQRFDEIFVMANPEIRGITLYWAKPEAPQNEQSTTASKLELDPGRQQLFVYPQSQKDLVIRIAPTDVAYQVLSMTGTEFDCQPTSSAFLLSLRDGDRRLEVRVSLTPENLLALKRSLP